MLRKLYNNYCSFSDWFIDKCIAFLNSREGFWAAFLGPLIVIPLSQRVKAVENIISSNWIQLWALFAVAVAAARIHAHVKKHLGND